MMSRNLVLRIASALVLIPLALGAVYIGGLVFKAFVLLLFVGSSYEWVAMSKTFKPRIVYLVIGILYFALSLYLLSELRDHENGRMLTGYLLFTVWASDTVAYIFGRRIGGPKLAPTIIPNKTWAGLLGSVVGVVFVMFGFTEAMYVSLTWGLSGILGAAIILGVTGQLGDLVESYMKRKANIKDSGKLIPGHGGVLDRIDALLLVTPVFYLIVMYGLN